MDNEPKSKGDSALGRPYAFYLVAIAITSALVAFVSIMLIFREQFSTTAVMAALSSLLAVIGTLVGTGLGVYFGIQVSNDTRRELNDTRRELGRAQLRIGDLTNSANTANRAAITAPTITIDPPTATLDTNQPHDVTATVTSIDRSPAANVAVTFAVTDGPDLNVTSTVMTDEFGRAAFTFTNNGNAGTDTIEAASLGGSGTATATWHFSG